MPSNIIWKEGHIEVAPPKKPKKITGTRFATILGLNPWSSPFEIWCAVTRTYEKPFEDTVYTIAGKTIEPKQIAYMRSAYAMTELRTPTDIYGADYWEQTWGDFFPNTEILGGSWDSLLVDGKGMPETVLEFKTTKRSEDWGEDIPEYYALQAALYAHLLGIDEVIMIASFLSPKDYEHPENFVPAAKNTITRQFLVSERYPDFAEKVEKVKKWWEKYVLTGISPDYDEKQDAEILEALRTTSISPDEDIENLIAEAEGLKQKIDENHSAIAKDEKRYKTLTDAIKARLMKDFTEGIKKVTVNGKAFQWEVSKSESMKVDEDKLKADGLLEKYKTKPTTTYRISASKPKD